MITTSEIEHSKHAVHSQPRFQPWDYIVFVTLSAALIYAIGKFLAQWVSLDDLIQTPISYLILSAVLAVVLLNNCGRWFLLFAMKRPTPIPASPNWNVAVVTTFVSHSESVVMLEQTLKALVALEYPHDTWVLDESNDDNLKALCQKLGVRHFSRKDKPKYQAGEGQFKPHTKYGNYNAWLDEIGFDNYDIVSAFDPDHVPQPKFLSKILGYFESPNIGYVQVAQAYYNQDASFIARGAAEETYAYYSSVEMSSYAMGYPIIIGSHNTHRVSALRQVGGLAAHDADDLLLTRLYKNQGWEGIYVPEILARGMTPVDWPGYLGQQRRWARSVIDLKLRTYPQCTEKVSFGARIYSILHGLTYLHKSITLVVLQLLLIYLLLTGESPHVLSPEMIPNYVGLWLILLVCELYRQRFYIDWPREWGSHWRVALLQLGKSFYMLFALFDVVLARTTEYELTPKLRPEKQTRFLLWPNALMALIIFVAWIYSAAHGTVTNPIIHLAALTFVGLTLILIYSESLPTAEPFDKSLLEKYQNI